MSINYTTYVSQLANLMIVGSTDANFQTFLPGCIDYAEQRIYRELDLAFTTEIDTNSVTVANTRVVTLSTVAGQFVVIEEVSAFSSAGTTSSNGTRSPLAPTSREFINTVYPSNTTNTGIPLYWNLLSQTEIVVGPAPDAAYTLEVIGTMRPTPLSSGNSSTFLTQNLPDLFVAASMVFATGYQRDWGAQANDPQAGASWENQYQILKQSAASEEARKKWQGDAWTAESSPPNANPPRV